MMNKLVNKILVVFFIFSQLISCSRSSESNEFSKLEVIEKDGVLVMRDGSKSVTGKLIDYWEDDQKKFEIEYQNGIMSGKAVFYDSTGHKISEGFNKDGKAHGKITKWYKNGNKESEIHYLFGRKDGISKKWYEEDGQLQWKKKYNNEVPVGKWAYYYSNGQLDIEFETKNGQADDYIIKYHPNGNKKEEGKVEKGQKVGLWKYYSEDGTLTKTEELNPTPEEKQTE